MKAAYADPPYLGCGQKHYGALHSAAADTFHDLFLGSGAVTEAWTKWRARIAPEQLEIV